MGRGSPLGFHSDRILLFLLLHVLDGLVVEVGQLPGTPSDHHIPGKTRGGELTRRWLDGIYLGMRWTSGEHLVAMRNGRVVKARSLQPFPLEKLWDSDRIGAIIGVPWNPVGTAQRPAAEDQEPHRPEDDIDGEQQQGPGPKATSARVRQLT